MSNGHNGTVFRVLYPKISTGQEKLAPTGRHVFATLPLHANVIPPGGKPWLPFHWWQAWQSRQLSQSASPRLSTGPPALLNIIGISSHLRNLPGEKPHSLDLHLHPGQHLLLPLKSLESSSSARQHCQVYEVLSCPEWHLAYHRFSHHMLLRPLQSVCCDSDTLGRQNIKQ